MTLSSGHPGKLTQTPPVQMQAPLRQMTMARLHLRAQQHLGMSEGCCQQQASERRAKPQLQDISPALWPRLTAMHGYCRREISTRYCRDSWAMQENPCSPRCTPGPQNTDLGSTHRSTRGSWERSRDWINSDPYTHHSSPDPSSSPFPSCSQLG